MAALFLLATADSEIIKTLIKRLELKFKNLWIPYENIREFNSLMMELINGNYYEDLIYK